MGSADEREQWGNKIDFILSCLGFAVGLGNVWRFPYLCGRNGGAAFMIPYFIMMIFAGFPLFYLELAIGQFSRVTPAILYGKMCPVFSGIGTAMVIISAYTALYYNMILAWSLHYLGSSMQKTLPWSDCNNWWNNDACLNNYENKSCHVDLGGVYWERRCANESDFSILSNGTGSCYGYQREGNVLIRDTECGNYTFNTFKQVVKAAYTNISQSPSEQYLNNRVYGLSEGIHHMGYPRWELVLALLGAWFIIFLCLIKGIKSAGKVVYFTATFPYLILFILMIRGMTLPGAIDGIKFYVIPNITRLADAKVWGDAAIQIFFSLSLGGGGLATLASYNEFDNNILRDTLIVVLGNCGTSIFAGFVIFPILGFIAKTQLTTVEAVARSGVGLAFIAYPDAIIKIPPAQFWAVLFFFMLILLGLDSEIVLFDVVVTAILDRKPKLRQWRYKILVVGGLCLVGWILGLFLCCPGGPYVLTIMDNYAAGWPLIITCICELIMVSYLYGIRRFMSDIRMMLGKSPNMCWTICGYPVNPYWLANWLFITPVLLTGILIFNWVQFSRSKYNDSYTFPIWADVIGWLMAFSSVIWILITAVYKIVKCKKDGKPWKSLITPSDDWTDSRKGRSSPEKEKENGNYPSLDDSHRIATAQWKGHENIVFPSQDYAPKKAYENSRRLDSYNEAVNGHDKH